jgi:beta-lactamase regulating signal transducer with metallopeptidase domain
VVPQEVTMVLGLLSLLVAVACIIIILSLALKSRFRKTTILVWLMSIIVLLLTLILFYYAFSQLTQVGVGSFMGSGALDISIPGGEAQTKVPCSWGPGIGFYLLIVSLVLVVLSFFGKRVEGRLSRK